MNAKSLATEIIAPSGKVLLIFLLSTLTSSAIAWEYLHSDIQFGLLVFPLLGCTILSALLGIGVVPLLNRLKTGQIVQEDGPQTHLQKAGTPTMGGIFFVPVAVAISLILVSFNPEANLAKLAAVCLTTLGYGFIGWIDDWQVLRRKSNKGISPKMKLILQVLFGTLFTLWVFWHESATVAYVDFPGGLSISLGWLFLPLAIFVLTAESNATNLTDGVDGLAAGTGAIAFLGLAAIVVDTPELAIFCACMAGGCLGFLVHNHNPAKVFMGDTGSLALGGAIGAVGISSGNLWALFVVSGIFFIESLSVIAQVLYYKATKDENGQGKRLFKMAPVHHHFELSGWQETRVVGMFYVVNLILVAIAYYLR